MESPNFITKLYNGVLNLIFPNTCGFCDEVIDGNKLICSKCYKEVKFPDFCRKCGMPINECRCKIKKFFFDGCACGCEYQGVARNGILKFKYHYAFNCAEYICCELAKKLERYGFAKQIDIITAIPMTRKRYLQTGYNQSEEMAKIMSKLLNKPCVFKLLKKNPRLDYRQHEQSKAMRKSLAINSYMINPKHKDVKGKTVLLCDDITTTGSTLSQCARLLKEMGAERVYCAVLASTPAKKTDKEG